MSKNEIIKYVKLQYPDADVRVKKRGTYAYTVFIIRNKWPNKSFSANLQNVVNKLDYLIRTEQKMLLFHPTTPKGWEDLNNE